MTRRDILAKAIIGFTGAALSAKLPDSFPKQPRQRLAVSTYPFRSFIASSNNKTGMSLDEFAASIVSKMDVTGLSPGATISNRRRPFTFAHYIRVLNARESM